MIEVLKTFEINDDLWDQISEGFRESFNRDINAQYLKKSFCVRTQWGYGYHAIDYDEKTHEIRGFNTFTPTQYKNNIKVLVSGSSFVKEKYRKDVFIFLDMVNALRKRGLEDGFALTVGVPNHNSFKYSQKILKTTFIGYLNYYILPINISRCIHKPVLSFCNPITRLWSKIHLDFQLLSSQIHNTAENNVKYRLQTDETFYQARFNDPCYGEYDDGVYKGYYRIVNEDGTKTAYLMDFVERGVRTKRSLIKVVKYISSHEKPDAILFVGLLNLRQSVLMKVPWRLEPKHLPLMCYLIDKSRKDELLDMSDINNWDFSLINFDVR